jgi:dihydrodipicolinate synthase/N-acetylneuraminate lyase
VANPKPQNPPAISGVNVAAITPRRAGEVEVDLGAMLELVDFLGRHGAQSITLFGSTGEFVHFTPQERSRFVALASKRSRVPVLANVSHSTLDGTIAMAEEAAGSGVAGVLVMPPYYYRYSAGAIEAFCRECACLVSRYVPVYLYNMPWCTSELDVETAVSLLSSGLFAGIKDSSGDWNYIERLLRLRAERPFTLLVGHERLYRRAREAGADGVVSGIANAVPELLAALDRAMRAGATELVDRLDARLQEFVPWITRVSFPVALKEGVALRGIKAGPPASPPGDEESRLIDEFRSWFREWLPIVQKECQGVS